MKSSRLFVPQDSVYPLSGINAYDPQTLSDARFSPDCSNVTVTDGVLRKRPGYAQLGDDLTWIIDGAETTETVLLVEEFENFAGTRFIICVTDKHHYKYDVDNESWNNLSAGELIQNCDVKADWTVSANVTSVSTPAKEGTASVGLFLVEGFTTGLVAYANIDSVNITAFTGLDFWVNSSVALDAADYSIALCQELNGVKAGVYVSHGLPALEVGIWTRVRITGDYTNLNAVVSIGIYQDVDKAANAFSLDDIRVTNLWTGDEDDWVEGLLCADEGNLSSEGKYILTTNGRAADDILWWDGSETTFTVFTTGIAGFETCRAMTVYNNHLVLGNITTTAVNPQSLYWSVAGDFTDFSSVGSGTVLVADLHRSIQKLIPIGDRVAVFAEDSIAIMTYVGGDLLFVFENLVDDTRLLSGRTVVSVGPYLLYMSQENIYLFDGTRIIQPVGEAIRNAYRAEVSLQYASRSFAFHDPAHRQVYWIVALSDTEAKTYLLEYDVYDIARLRWVPFTYADRPSAMGFYSQPTDMVWHDVAAGVTWHDMIGVWNQSTTRQDFPIRMIGASSGKVFTHEDLFLSDDGTDVTSYWDSIQFTVPGEYLSMLGRWIEIEFELRGTSVDVYYSIDRGSTWTSIETLTLANAWDRYSSFFDVASKTLQVRLKSTGPNFELRWLRLWITEGGEP